MFEDRLHPIIKLKNQYPQLLLPIKPGISKSDLYKNVVYLGSSVPSGEEEFGFTLSDQDYLTKENFTCGEITILFLPVRKDFENFVQKTAYRCEPKKIPASMGAVTISGLNNWEKIKRGKSVYEENSFFKENGTNPSDFLKNKYNYQDSIIVLSQGFYSGLAPKDTPYSNEEWLDIALQIRKYHELTHYICRKKYSTLKNALLDEIFADCMGLIISVGRYEDLLAKQFLGIDREKYKQGMRLENYLFEGEDLEVTAEKARLFIQKLKELTEQMSSSKEEFEDNIDQFYPRAYDLYTSMLL